MAMSRRTGSRAEWQIRKEDLLRSINLVYDAENAESVAHFRPTSKSVLLVRSILGLETNRASLVVAPYGSGKSLTAEFALHLIENRGGSVDALRGIAKRLESTNPGLAKFAASRLGAKTQGLAFALHGACESLPQSIQLAAVDSLKRMRYNALARRIQRAPAGDIRQAIQLLKLMQEEASKSGLDRVAVIWDEFGRHLDALVAEGRMASLAEVQLLAEFCSRTEGVPVTLTLLLHQSLLNYASGSSQLARNEWKKVEGRFQVLRYVDDSKEVFRLIADVVAGLPEAKQAPDTAIHSAASTSLALGLFADFEPAELEEILRRAYPLTPVVLHLLPRVSARVAQNERTLFNFLFSIRLHGQVRPDALYDYFSGDMRADTSIGGTHRQWLETQSALSKLGPDGLRQVALKSACLLGLGASGERTRVSRQLLVFATGGYDEQRVAARAVSDLVARKLLLHRRHADDVSVWHGTDVDLRGRLEDEVMRVRGEFDLVEFLSHEAPPPVWRPVKHNDRHGTRRYFAAEFVGGAKLCATPETLGELQTKHENADGLVIYCLADTPGEVKAAVAFAARAKGQKLVVCAVPRAPIPVFDAAVEVAALLNLQRDPALVASDPLVLPELQQLTDDARSGLQRVIDRLTHPNMEGQAWHYNGTVHSIGTIRELRDFLSRLTDRVYSRTPTINSEAVLRQKLTSVQVNARKKLLIGILESSGLPSFRLEGHTPDVAMFRTVLLNTGLYRVNGTNDAWRYAVPDEIEDRGLREVWSILKEFFTAPDEVPKSFEKLLSRLVSPPFGLRRGAFPILIAAALKAFPADRSLTRDGEYIEDLRPSVIEALCAEPARYSLRVLDLSPNQRAYLLALCEYFSASSELDIRSDDLIRTCYDALRDWSASLPAAALSSRGVSRVAGALQKLVAQNLDPVDLFFNEFPRLLSVSVSQCDLLLEGIRGACDELQGLAVAYREHAVASIRRLLGFLGTGRDKSVCALLARWRACFPDAFVIGLSDIVVRRVLVEAERQDSTDHELVDHICLLLVGKQVDQWDDLTPGQFERRLQEVVHRLESDAIEAGVSLAEGSTDRDGLCRLVEARMKELHEHLVRIAGPERANAVLNEAMRNKSGGSRSD